MRTPLRLAMAVFKARLAQSSGKQTKYPPVTCVRIPADRGEAILSSASAKALAESPRSGRRHELRRTPVAWLARGADPGSADTLEHTSISRLARELQDDRRFVFLETDGQQLRRRIHEFRPDARLYLTVRLYGTAAAHDQRVQKPGAFSLAMEGIRAAQLSGYLVCVHVVIDADTKISDVSALLDELAPLEVDGAVATAASSSGPEPLSVRQYVFAARNLIGHSWWAEFSVDVELAIAAAPRKVLFAPSISSSPEDARPEDALATDEAIAQ